MECRLRKQIQYKGSCQGIHFLINNWSWNNWETNHWAFYLFFHVDRLPESIAPEELWCELNEIHNGLARYDYYKSTLLSKMDWHGGITFYEKVRGFDGESQEIKAGCDYGHYFDEGITYDEKDILLDIQRAIDSFWEEVPDYKCFCCGNGKLYLVKDGEFREPEGDFYSNEYLNKKEEKA